MMGNLATLPPDSERFKFIVRQRKRRVLLHRRAVQALQEHKRDADEGIEALGDPCFRRGRRDPLHDQLLDFWVAYARTLEDALVTSEEYIQALEHVADRDGTLAQLETEVAGLQPELQGG